MPKVISIFKGKAKDWPSYFKKRFGKYKPNTTLASVVNNEVSYLGNHVTNFLTERANATNKYDKKSQAK
tara:strand:- start:388 stop:594 length:207 start_codon:yes stop_codon:yes gene_type:complete